MRDLPGIVLTRHFFTSLFDFGFLSDDGAESLKRALLGSLAVAIALGLLLTRVFRKKYPVLSAGPVDDYAHELLADHAFLMAVPMWFIAGAVALVGHSLFPDQTDFRILMAEPLSRLTIFTAKLASLLLFVGLFVAGTHLALLPLTAFTMIGAMKTGSILTAAMAFMFSSVIASLFAALAVVAVHGLLVLFAPRALLLAFSGAVRGVLVGVLVLSLPLLARLPGTAAAFGSDAWWLPWAPPAWFIGLERWLIDDGRYAALAAEAAIATVLVLIVSVATYVLLYHRFDRVMLQPASSRARRLEPVAGHVGRPRAGAARHPPFRVDHHPAQRPAPGPHCRPARRRGRVRAEQFAECERVEPAARHAPTIAVHFDAPVGAGDDDVPRNPGHPSRAVRAARPAIELGLPDDRGRRRPCRGRRGKRPHRARARSGGAARAHRAGSMVGAGPVGCRHHRARSVVRLAGRRVDDGGLGRIPFTCSYIPGKGFVPHMFVKGFASYLVFTTLATVILRVSLARPRVALSLH